MLAIQINYIRAKLPNMFLNGTDSRKGYGYGYGYGKAVERKVWYKKLYKKSKYDLF
jgi:hypothetical protein